MTQERKYKDGDIVQLKSGGPKMTVEGYDMLGNVICRWFERNKSSQDTFSEDALQPVAATAGGPLGLGRARLATSKKGL